MHSYDQLVREIVDAGVRGYLAKSDSDRDLVIAVEALAKHRPFLLPCEAPKKYHMRAKGVWVFTGVRVWTKLYPGGVPVYPRLRSISPVSSTQRMLLDQQND
jgi:hypothetical protein